MGVKNIPVSKRNDYIRKFETLVKQEIALHNKKVQEADQRLNSFDRSLKLQCEQTKEKLSQFEQYCVDLRKHFDQTYKSDEKLSQFETKFGKLQKEQQQLHKDHSKLKEFVESLPTASGVKDCLVAITDEINEFLAKMRDEVLGLSSEFRSLQRAVEKQEKRRLEDHLSSVKMIEAHKKEIEEIAETVKETAFNSEWVKRDMKKKQKSIFVLEKKFEYLDDKIKKLERKHSE